MVAQFLPLLIGIVAGIASGLFGIGGGIIIVPMLSFFLGYTMQQAAATSLAALMLPIGAAIGVMTYWRAGVISMPQIWIAALIAGGMMIGAFFGARLAIGMSHVWLSRSFAIFLVIIAARIWFKNS